MQVARSLWTGSISFGLVNIPIRLYSAVESRGLSFHFLHAKDKSPVRYAKICKEEDKEISYDEIVRAYEYKKGEYVVLTDEDFVRASPKKTKTIDIMDFCDEKEIDPMLFDKPYYLEPDRTAGKPYALLREALEQSGKVGVSKFVLRNKENLAVVKSHGNVLLLFQLRFVDEIRKPTGLNVPKESIKSKKELDIALALIEQLSGKFRAEKYHDTYTHELEKMIEAKVRGKVIRLPSREPKPGKRDDLMALLKESLRRPKKKAA